MFNRQMRKLSNWILIISVCLPGIPCVPAIAEPEAQFPGKGDRKAFDKANLIYSDGQHLAAAHEIKQAEKKFRKAIAIYPFSSMFFNELGLVLDEKGDLKAAEEAFRKGLVLEPDDNAVWNNLGINLENQGRLDEALTAYETALKYSPIKEGGPGILQNIATVKSKINARSAESASPQPPAH